MTGMSGMINIKGEWVVPPLFEPRGSLADTKDRDDEPRGLGFAPNGLAWVIENGRERIINSKGEFMPAFDAYIDKHRAELEIQRKELAQQLSQRKHSRLRIRWPSLTFGVRCICYGVDCTFFGLFF